MIGGIVGAVDKALGIAESIAKRAERGQLIDAGDARAVARTMKDVHEKLAAFDKAADRVDTDGDFARKLRDKYTIHD